MRFQRAKASGANAAESAAWVQGGGDVLNLVATTGSGGGTAGEAGASGEKGEKGDILSEELEKIGHEIKRKNMTSGLHIIVKDTEGYYHGVADQRREGTAAGNN